MGGLVGLACLFLAYVGYIRYRTLYNPVTLFDTFWGILCIGASLRFYQMIRTDIEVYLIIIIGVLLFTLFGILEYKVKKDKPLENTLNMKIITPLMIFNCIFSLIVAINVYSLAARGMDLSTIRALFALNTDVIFSNKLLLVLYQYVYNSSIYILLPVGTYAFFNRKFIFFFLVSFLILLKTLDGGRLIIIYYLIFLCFSFAIKYKTLMLNNMKHFRTKMKRRIGIVVALLVAVITYISRLRAVGDGFLKEAYFYMCGALPNFSHHIDRVISKGEYTYGCSFLGGILSPILFLLKGIGIISDYPSFFKSYMELSNCEYYVRIAEGEGAYLNSFVTIFFDFFLDGSYIGLIIDVLLFSGLSSIIYNKYVKYKSNKYLFLYCYIIAALLTSMMRWQFRRPYFIIAFLCTPIIWKYEKR